MSAPHHPYFQTHYESPNGRIFVKTCRPMAIVVTHDPRQVTCPRCQEGLQRLVDFLDALPTMDLDDVSA